MMIISITEMQDFLTKGSVCFLSLDMGYGGAEKVIATSIQ